MIRRGHLEDRASRWPVVSKALRTARGELSALRFALVARNLAVVAASSAKTWKSHFQAHRSAASRSRFEGRVNAFFLDFKLVHSRQS